jgi:hypothetical protein
MTLYIVSGYMRSGTSMMMRCLQAGGMDAVYSPDRSHEMNEKWGDDAYKPTDEYYELYRHEYLENRLQEKYDCRLVKALWGAVLRIPPGEYRVIFMRRPVEEIRSSLLAFFGMDSNPLGWENLDAQLDGVIGVLRDRKSVLSVHEVQYHTVLSDPLEVFKHLHDEGWPIDPWGASAQVNPMKARFLCR